MDTNTTTLLDKVDYLNQVDKFDKQINSLVNKKIELKKRYLEANREFKDKEKVKITLPNEDIVYGAVTGVDVNIRGRIDYVLRKLKSNGTINDTIYGNIRCWQVKKIERLTEKELNQWIQSHQSLERDVTLKD